ncbi:MAG: hypothetical protein JO007_04170 [Alphaproteobacteria bacterium]|nr:hypothetical protein [Alphaproteobacteria bacterium]
MGDRFVFAIRAELDFESSPLQRRVSEILVPVESYPARRRGGLTRCSQELTIAALIIAIQLRRPGAGLIHHSDRGSQGAFN